MRIEAIDKIRDTDDDGRSVSLEPGDVLTVGENFGTRACQLGWAKDVDGNVPTGERSRDPVTVSPQGLIVRNATQG